jgi:hypothetical protein
MSTQYPHRWDITHPKLLLFAAINIHSLTMHGLGAHAATRPQLASYTP